MKKIFFFDMDGTLLPHGINCQINEKTVKNIHKLHELGYDVVIATGKSLEHIKKEIALLKVKYAITSNGQVLSKDGKIVKQSGFLEEDLQLLENFVKERQLYLSYQTSEELFAINYSKKELDLKAIYEKMHLPQPVIRKRVVFDNVQQLEIIGQVEIRDLPKGFNYYTWGENAIDVLPKDVSKVSGIKMYLEFNNYVDYYTYGFGDSFNDFEMLEFVDCSVAMGNAVEELKEIADYITDDVEADGVNKFLEEYIL